MARRRHHRTTGPTPAAAGLWAGLHAAGMIVLLALAVGEAKATETVASTAAQAFADHCFRPTLTAETAAARVGVPGARVDFHDLRPFSDVAPAPVTGRPATPGTDRRCEVAFDGDHAAMAVQVALSGLDAEGITAEAPVPDTHQPMAGTALLAARFLNPNRIAVVHVGTRPHAGGVETFMTVERLRPSDEQ